MDAMFGVFVSEDRDKLSALYWLIKLHKSLYNHVFLPSQEQALLLLLISKMWTCGSLRDKKATMLFKSVLQRNIFKTLQLM